MTAIAAFFCSGGLLLCADREESSGGSKRSVQKLMSYGGIKKKNKWVAVMGAAGSAAAADLAVSEIGREFQSAKNLRSTHKQIIGAVLTQIHERYIWHNPRQDHSIGLVIGISFPDTSEQFLYRTQENIPQPCPYYASVGAGEDLIHYFAERLHRTVFSPEEMTVMASFIFREVSESVSNCGKGVDMIFLEQGNGFVLVDQEQVANLEKEIPDFTKEMQNFWLRVKIPAWLTFAKD